MNILYVALGGALGAVARYLISIIPLKCNFPILTLLTNLIGAIIIGIIVGLMNKEHIGDRMALFWKTGVCGGFTTFSTFSLESLKLLESGRAAIGITYMVVSLVMCIIGVVIGRYIGMLIKA